LGVRAYAFCERASASERAAKRGLRGRGTLRIVISARDLVAGYRHGGRRFPVLDVAGLEAATGRLTAVIGPNGGGKSTLLRTLTGAQPALAGDVFLDGDEIHHLDRLERARRVAVVLTDRVEPGLLSVGDVVLLGRHPHTGWRGEISAADEQIASEAATRLGVGALWSRPFAELSDGQRQRVLVARALAQQPAVLVLDEPTAFLDIAGRIELTLAIADLAHSGLTVLVATHDLELALSYADRVWLVSDGIVRDRSPGELATGDELAAAFLPAHHDAAHAASFDAIVTALHRAVPR
jgi:iron complex transport system ATP-binding protein